MLGSELLQKINQQVYRRFPDFKGIKPKVRTQSLPEAAAPNYLLTYESQASLENGKTLKRWVRVVADGKGKILKLSTSK